MTPRDLRGKVAIVGVGTAGCGEAPGYTEMELLAMAARAALADAGLAMRDVDGVCTANLSAATWPLGVIETLGLRPAFIDGTNIGGSAFVAHLQSAMLALDAGICDTVLVCYGSNQRSGTYDRKERKAARNALDPNPFEAPYAPFNPPSSYALIAARHMHQYGTTKEQMAEVAVATRKWALMNPKAWEKEPLTIEQALNARMVSYPFTVRDCCLVVDGGGAIVLTSAARAKTLKKKPVYVLGVGETL